MNIRNVTVTNPVYGLRFTHHQRSPRSQHGLSHYTDCYRIPWTTFPIIHCTDFTHSCNQSHTLCIMGILKPLSVHRLYTCFCGALWDWMTWKHPLWFRTPLKMSVPSNSALFEGIGGNFGFDFNFNFNFGYSQGLPLSHCDNDPGSHKEDRQRS